MIDSCFVSICKFGHLKNPFAMITSLSELYIQEIYSDFYELWQQYKQQKTIEMSEAWPDTQMRDINSNLNPITKFTSISRNAEFKDIIPWNYLNQHKNHSIHHANRHRLCDKTRHPIVSLMESWRKLRHQHDQNFPMEGKPL